MLLLQSLVALWHTAAFGAGGVSVYLCYRALFGLEQYAPRWGKAVRRADIHLWLSGFALIFIGAAISGSEKYFANPKLIAKVSVIIVWFFSTQFLRFYGLPRFKRGIRRPMLLSSAINLSCWIYGAFLGCAHGLSYGTVSYTLFMSGFVLALLLCVAVTSHLEKRNAARAIR